MREGILRITMTKVKTMTRIKTVLELDSMTIHINTHIKNMQSLSSMERGEVMNVLQMELDTCKYNVYAITMIDMINSYGVGNILDELSTNTIKSILSKLRIRQKVVKNLNRNKRQDVLDKVL